VRGLGRRVASFAAVRVQRFIFRFNGSVFSFDVRFKVSVFRFDGLRYQSLVRFKVSVLSCAV